MRTILLYLFSFWLTGCTVGTPDEAAKSGASLVQNAQLVLPLDSTSSQHMRAQYLPDPKGGKDYLVFQNKQRLLFYDLTTNKIAFSTTYAKEGPDGVSDSFSFYVKNTDSIFIKSPPFDIFLTDTSGKVKKKYALDSQKDNEGHTFSFYGTVASMNEVNVSGTNFYFLRWPDGFDKDFSVRKQPFLGQLDLTTSQAKILPVYYPKVFQEHHWPFIYSEVGIVHNPAGFVFNFPGSDSVFTWRDGETTSYYAASRHITTPIKFSGASPANLEEMHRPIIEQQCYPILAYDPYRQVHYRFAWHPHEDLSNIDNLTLIYTQKTCSIIVLDKNLNIIGETLLPRDRYFTKYWFIGPKGLYLSDAHPDNPDLNEDVLSYTLFTLADKAR